VRVNVNMKTIFFSIIICLVLLLPAIPAQADSGNVYDMIAQVNAVRASNGLAALQTDGALMASAQAHAEYMASTGSCSHTGAGGTSPKQRMASAGYGGGAPVWGTENIMCGNFSVSEVTTWWQGDELHLLPYKEGNYRSIGGGIATAANGYRYFVIDVAYTSGGNYTSPSISTTITPGGENLSSTTVAAQRVAPVITATLQADGSLIHEVEQGQAYWSIAIAYGIKVNDIIQMNGLSSSSVLRIGQKLRIHGPYTTTPELSETPTLEPDTPTPTITQTPTITPTPTLTSTPTPRPLFEGASGLQKIDRRGLGIGLVVICVVGLGLMIVGGIRRKNKETIPDYDPLDPPIDSL
jgi:LysM repeat protein